MTIDHVELFVPDRGKPPPGTGKFWAWNQCASIDSGPTIRAGP
jgi:hypothetical protein